MSARRARRRALCAVGLSAGLLLAAAAPATAHSVDRTKIFWPYDTISYYMGPEIPGANAMRRAVKAWNDADVGYRIVRASQERADFQVLSLEFVAVRRGTCVGKAFQGYAFAQSAIGVGGDCDPYVRVLGFAHEIGHMLNLQHDDDECAVMNTRTRRGAPNRRMFARPESCAPGHQYWREPVRPDDAAGGRAARREPFRFPEVICYPRDEPRSPVIRNALLCNKEYNCRGVKDPNPIGPAAQDVNPQTGRFRFLERCRERDYRLSAKPPAGRAGPLGAVHMHTFGGRGG